MSQIDYKSKYQELKNKFMNSVDLAFRLGYEAGSKDAQVENMQMQQIQAAQATAQPQQEGQEEAVPSEEAPASENPQGSELDSHIAELEAALGKSEGEVKEQLTKVLIGLKKSQEEKKMEEQLKKSQQAIGGIAKALHNPVFKLSQAANHNLSTAAKHSLNTQEEIVKDIMEKWEKEEAKSAKEIAEIFSIEGITKKG